MKIEPNDEGGNSRTGTLRNTSVEEINRILGFTPNVPDDPYKVVNSWGFKADGIPCGIWDYKGSHKAGQFSTDGPAEVFIALFGNKYSR
jgi:hypothetical protein